MSKQASYIEQFELIILPMKESEKSSREVDLLLFVGSRKNSI